MLLAIAMLAVWSATDPFIQAQFDRELSGQPWLAQLEVKTEASEAIGTSEDEASYAALPAVCQIQFTWCDPKHWSLTVSDASAASFAHHIARSGSFLVVDHTVWDAEFLSEWSLSQRIQTEQKKLLNQIIPFDVVSEVFFPLTLGMRVTPVGWADSYVVREVPSEDADRYRVQLGVQASTDDPFRSVGTIEFDAARQAIAERTTTMDGQPISRVTWIHDANGTIERVTLEQSRGNRLEKIWEARVLERTLMSHEECSRVIPDERSLRDMTARREWRWGKNEQKAR